MDSYNTSTKNYASIRKEREKPLVIAEESIEHHTEEESHTFENDRKFNFGYVYHDEESGPIDFKNIEGVNDGVDMIFQGVDLVFLTLDPSPDFKNWVAQTYRDKNKKYFSKAKNEFQSGLLYRTVKNMFNKIETFSKTSDKYTCEAAVCDFNEERASKLKFSEIKKATDIKSLIEGIMKNQIQSEDVEAILELHRKKSKSKKVPKLPPIERYHTMFVFNVVKNYWTIASLYFIWFSWDEKYIEDKKSDRLNQIFKVIDKIASTVADMKAIKWAVMPTLSQKRNNRLARVIKNLVHRRMRSLYLSHVTKDMSKKDTTPRGPFMSSYEVPEHMQFDHKGYQKDVNFFLEVEDNSDFSLSPEKKDGKTEAEDLALLEEIQAREDLKEELEIAKKKFIYKLDKIRGIIGFRFNLEHLLED